MAVRADGGAEAVSDDERWEQALRRARALSPQPRLDADRERRRSALTSAVVLVVVVGVLGVVAQRLAGGAPGPVFARTERTVVAAVGVVLATAGLVRSWVDVRRIGGWGGVDPTPARLLTREQRRGVWRQVRGAEPVDEVHLPVALDVARREVFCTGRICTGLGTTVTIGSRYLGSGAWLDVMALVLCGLVVAVVARAARTGRASLRFLEEHQSRAS